MTAIATATSSTPLGAVAVDLAAADADMDGICRTSWTTASANLDGMRASATVQRAIYDCGCSDIPVGVDCDCDGNQLDALGECGGPCEADADMDGI